MEKTRTKILALMAALFLLAASPLPAQNSPHRFEIRGVLPWHNFLSGPTAWNLGDYEKYLDVLQKHGINFIGFHNYTGGGQRYATYVEPMIKIQYKGILPEAFFDNSLTVRWGYTPMKVEDFAFGTSRLFDPSLQKGGFGSDGSVRSVSKEQHYENAQDLMRTVLRMAHERGIRMAMGFEFGVFPPEYYSLRSDDDFFWNGEANMIPNPAHCQSVEILQATLDNILETYPDLDCIWLWLNEHSSFGADLRAVLQSPSFKPRFEANRHFFSESDVAAEFIGVWSLEYVRLVRDYVQRKKPGIGIILGGWGGSNQLPSIMRGLDRSLPADIVFSLLNPGLGTQPPRDFLAEIAKNRPVIAVPWLEGDHQLWHFQPRVRLMGEHIQRAARMKLDGVAAIHWRTEETRWNLETFARFACSPEDSLDVERLYREYFRRDFGERAAKILAGPFADFDRDQWNHGLSMEFYPYTPQWGRIGPQDRIKFEGLLGKVVEAIERTDKSGCIENLNWIRSKIEFALLLDDVGRKLEPAWNLRNARFLTKEKPSPENLDRARRMLESAPVQKLFETFASGARSRGELGEISSLNQKLWREVSDLKRFFVSGQSN